MVGFLFYLVDGFLYFSLRMFSNEDVTIGSWMLAMNVQHEDKPSNMRPSLYTYIHCSVGHSKMFR